MRSCVFLRMYHTASAFHSLIYQRYIFFLFLFYFFLNLFIFGCVGSLLRCAGFSLRWLLLLRSMGSRCTGFSSCGSQAVKCRLSSCGSRAYLLRGMWDLPGPGIEPVSPTLAGRFLSTVPPGKLLNVISLKY